MAQGGNFSGIYRKVQLKPLKWDDEGVGPPYGREPYCISGNCFSLQRLKLKEELMEKLNGNSGMVVKINSKYDDYRGHGL
ncbi:hypothetical protein YC2023_005708 [Brassica napus]